jgi:hypothetical protein
MCAAQQKVLDQAIAGFTKHTCRAVYPLWYEPCTSIRKEECRTMMYGSFGSWSIAHCGSRQALSTDA